MESGRLGGRRGSHLRAWPVEAAAALPGRVLLLPGPPGGLSSPLLDACRRTGRDGLWSPDSEEAVVPMLLPWASWAALVASAGFASKS
eukprot:1800920-Pyramimonas_sp.AAC.1